MKTSRIHRPRGWTLTETLVTIAIIAVLAAICWPLVTSFKNRANRATAAAKLREIGAVFVAFTTDRNGDLPWEDAPGSDDWSALADPENNEVWYNALTEMLGGPSAAALVKRPALFYTDDHPLYMPGAPYPSSDRKRESKPYFAIAMNSRLQRKNDQDVKIRGKMSSIMSPANTVIFLERGMPGDQKTNSGQRGFDASPKGNPRAFAARYNGKGLLIFADGHVDMYSVSDLILPSGQIVTPQNAVCWTLDPDDDPN